MSTLAAARLLWLWAPPVAEMVVIFSLSAGPLPTAGPALPDKLLHVTVYGLLALLLLRAVAGGRWHGVSGRTVALAVILTGLYGVTDEWHQSFVPARTAEAGDLLADVCGGVIGAGGAWTWDIIRRARRDSVS